MVARCWGVWKDLTRIERQMTRRTALEALNVAVRFRLQGYGRTREYAEGSERRKRDLPSSETVHRTTQRVLRRLPWSPNCLERSLVVFRVIRHHGGEPNLQLGVRNGDQALEFHAWVEEDGVVIGDSAKVTQTFKRFGEKEIPPGAVVV